MKQISLSFIAILLFNSIAQSISANPADFTNRQLQYVQSLAGVSSQNALILQAYQNLQLDQQHLQDILDVIPTKSTSDFQIVQLIRILFLSNGQYDSAILATLADIPFWLTKSDTLRGYWSENHMIMWMSSDWLLHEKYGKQIDANLRNRLEHYLNLKIQYGYYEFFSGTYAPYSLSGLLNLYDFTQDTVLKNKAELAAQRLLTDLLMLTNNQGVFYPIAGRNYPGRYTNPYNHNHFHPIHLLTGLGAMPQVPSHSGAFLATSTLPIAPVLESFNSKLDTSYHIGHSMSDFQTIHSNMSQLDRLMFQWSSGAYFHPDVVYETGRLLTDSNLWRHVDFRLLRPLSFLQPADMLPFAEALSCLSKSSVITGQQVSVFKNGGVTLSSIYDFWKGKVGFQQYPCVAAVGKAAVYTASGEPKADWEDRNTNNGNIHLPLVSQKSNAALLMYRHEPCEGFAPGFENKDVALHFIDADFDEVNQNGNWLVAKQDDNYVAVWQHCVDEVNGVRYCSGRQAQTWAIVVGNAEMYGSFGNFQSLVSQANVNTSWSYNAPANISTYSAEIVFDTLTIQALWEADSIQTSSALQMTQGVQLSIYPNPATEKLIVETVSDAVRIIKIDVIDLMGRVVFSQNFDSYKAVLDVESLNAGMYQLSVELSGSERFYINKFFKH